MGIEPDRSVKLTPDVASGAVAPRPSRILSTSSPLRKLSAVVLLSGAIRTSDLARSIGRSVLDLPLDQSTTILQQWRNEVAALARSIGMGPLELRVMMDRYSIMPSSPVGDDAVRVKIGQDPQDYRGTAGILRDISMNDDENSYMLVANGNQVLLEPLEELAHDLSNCGGDITLLAHGDGTPTGVMLIRVGAIRGVRVLGFMDFKEQVLPKLAEEFDVRVLTRERATGLPVRTLDGYIAALTAHHRRLAGRPAFGDEVGSEQWFSTFSIQEDGATVAASARVHDSVILHGARVGTDAVIVRSVVSGTAVVKSGQLAADRVVDRSTDLSTRGME